MIITPQIVTLNRIGTLTQIVTLTEIGKLTQIATTFLTSRKCDNYEWRQF